MFIQRRDAVEIGVELIWMTLASAGGLELLQQSVGGERSIEGGSTTGAMRVLSYQGYVAQGLQSFIQCCVWGNGFQVILEMIAGLVVGNSVDAQRKISFRLLWGALILLLGFPGEVV